MSIPSAVVVLKSGSRFCLRCALVAMALGAGLQARAQLSLSSAVDLAQRNSPRVQMAQADVARSRASLSVSRDAFIPSVATTGGYGRSTGAPLGVPVIYSISAQSLLYSFSQQDYIRSARAGLDASEHALAEARIEVTEDTTNTYLALNNALERREALRQTAEFAARLVEVIHDRIDAGVDTHIELTRAQIQVTQIRLQVLELKDEIANHTQHLASLTGIPTSVLKTDPQSIPQFAPLAQGDAAPAAPSGYSEGVAAAYSIAKSRALAAKGDRRYLLLPQVTLQGNYSRVDTALSSYTAYYPRFNGPPGGPQNSQNALGFEAAITIPILDFTHRARAKETAADAAHALADAHQQESIFLEGRARLQNSTLELDGRSELARLNQQLAQDQLDELRVQMEPGASTLAGPQITPKDELNAELQERLRYLDVLNAELQLQQTRINLLRQQGQLGDFIHQSLSTPDPSQATPVGPTVPGVPPGGTPPVIPSSGVTGGSVPNPSSVPNPTAPAGQPHP